MTFHFLEKIAQLISDLILHNISYYQFINVTILKILENWLGLHIFRFISYISHKFVKISSNSV